MKFLILYLLCLIPEIAHGSQKTTLGFVYSQETQQAVENATILARDKGVFVRSDSLGIFEITVEQGTLIRIIHADFITHDTIVSDTSMKINLISKSFAEKIGSEEDDFDQEFYYKTYPAKTTIESEMLSNVPQSSFFSDISMGLSLLPGVNRTSGWSSLLNVRGGSPFENLYMLNGLPVFSHYMWGGHLSVFNANLVQSMNVYKGNFPAKYPYSLSGVFDIHFREGSTEKFSGEVNVSADAGIILEGPLSDNTSFIASGRRSYYDFFSNMIINVNNKYDDNPVKMPYFNDFYGSVSHNLSNQFKLKLWALGVEDGGNFLLKYNDSTLFSDDDRLNYKVTNFLGALELIYEPDNTNRFNFTVSHSYYKGFQNHNDFILSIDTQAKQTYNGFKLEYSRQGENSMFNAGAYTLLFDAFIEHEVNGYVKFENSDTLSFVELDDKIERNDFFVNTGFAEMRYNFGKLTVIPGFNMFYNNMVEVNRITVDPRLNLSYHLFNNNFINSGAGFYSKPILTHISDANKLLPEKAMHFFLGFSSSMLNIYRFSAEAFYKNYDNLLVEYWDNSSSQIKASNEMKGFSRGIELMLQKSSHKDSRVDGIIAYTFAKSHRAATYEIDSLVWFLPPQDQNHTMSIMVNYCLLKRESRALTLKNRFDFNTGRPYRDFNISEAVLHNNDTILQSQTIYTPQPTDLYLRLPYHMNLDVGFEYVRNFQKFDISTYIIIMNILNRKNVTGYVVNNRTGEKLPEISYPGGTIPTAGVKIKF